MPEYTKLNLILLIMAIATNRFLLRPSGHRSVAFKIALLVPFLGFPWDHFGISHRAWGHSDPGPIFLGVPLNEMALAFLMSYITAGALLSNRRTILEEARSKSNAEDSRNGSAEGNPNRLGSV